MDIGRYREGAAVKRSLAWLTPLCFLGGAPGAADLQVFPCPNPVEIRIQDRNAAAGKYLLRSRTCGTGGPGNLDSLAPHEVAGFRERFPRIELLHSADGGIDVRFDWQPGNALYRYRADGVQPGRPAELMARVDSGVGPQLLVEARAVRGGPFVGLLVHQVPVDQVVAEIARQSGVSIERPELLGSRPVDLNFQSVSLFGLLQTLAGDSAVLVQRRGFGVFALGVARDWDEIQKRIAEFEGSRATVTISESRAMLRRILRLASPNDAEDSEVYLPEIFEELIQADVDLNDHAAAERDAREYVEHCQRLTGGPESSESASAMAELARVLFLAGQDAAAQELLVRAVGIMERAVGPEAHDLRPLLSMLGTHYHQSGRLDDAREMMARALAILDLDPEPDAHLFEHAHDAASLGTIYAKLQHPDLAIPQFERAIELEEALFEEDVSLRKTLILQLAWSAIEAHRLELAEKHLPPLISLFDDAPLQARLGFGYFEAVDALFEARVRKGDLGGAAAAWRRIAEVRESVLGEAHPRTRLARAEAAFLKRLEQPDRDPSVLAPTLLVPAEASEPPVPSGRLFSVDLEWSLRRSVNAELDWQQQNGVAADLVTVRLLQASAELEIEKGLGGGAIAHLERALEVRLQLPAKEHPDAGYLGRRLIAVHESRGDLRAAERVRLRLRPAGSQT